MTNICQFSIEKQVPVDDFLSDIFKNLNVDIKMSISCGQDEPLTCPKNAFFSCVIGIYFVTYFIVHPVVIFSFSRMKERKIQFFSISPPLLK